MNLAELAVQTVRDPQSAAERIMALGLPRRELYLALLAVSALTALLASGASVLGPPLPADALQEMPALALFQRPLALFVLLAGGLVVMVHALYWVGSALGGKGDLGDLMALLSWLQALRVAAQIVVLGLGFVVPAIAGLVALVVAVVAFWLTLHFISAALRLDSLLKALGVVITVAAGLFVGLMMVLTLFGLTGAV